MKGKGGLRFKFLQETESKPFQQNQGYRIVSKEPRAVGEVLNRKSRKVPSSHRRELIVGAYSQSLTTVDLLESTFHNYWNQKK